MTSKYEQFPALGTKIELLAIDNRQTGKDITWEETVVRVKHLVERLENTFSRFRVQSELSQLNTSPNRWIQISKEMWSVLHVSQSMYSKTNGIFNPCLGSWMESIGYDRPFDEMSPESTTSNLGIQGESPETMSTNLPNQERLPYALVDNPCRTYLQAGYKFDLGGIAKGWIVEQTARLLQNVGWIDFMISAGGDMVCSGEHEEGPWRVAIQNPFEPSKSLLSMDVRSACIATSGIGKRNWNRGAKAAHHILDPRTGESADSDIYACSVVAPDLISAEVYAKVVLILGSQEGMHWLAKQKLYGYVVVKKTGEVIHSWG